MHHIGLIVAAYRWSFSGQIYSVQYWRSRCVHHIGLIVAAYLSE